MSSSLRMPQVFSSLYCCRCIRGEVVFDNFVFDDTHTGFFHGHLGQGDTGIAAARAAARKILSLALCAKLANSRCASLTWSTRPVSSAILVTAMFIS
ncbi:hypothetical protein ACLK19_08470 [Escherichia coli]